eukprot:503756-Hanusia_phi.AAC.1
MQRYESPPRAPAAVRRSASPARRRAGHRRPVALIGSPSGWPTVGHGTVRPVTESPPGSLRAESAVTKDYTDNLNQATDSTSEEIGRKQRGRN